MKKLSSVIYGKHRKFKILKHHASSKKTVVSIICSKCENEDEKLSKEQKSVEILKNSWFNWKRVINLRIWLKKT